LRLSGPTLNNGSVCIASNSKSPKGECTEKKK
jgi:hypothetical protein